MNFPVRLLRRIRLTSIGFGLLFATLAAVAQPVSVFEDSVFVDEAEQGLHLLYDMRFDEAAEIFDRLAAQYPEHPAGPFMQALNTWWMILTDLENEAYDKAFTKSLKEVIKRSDRRLKRDEYDVDGLFFKGLAVGLRGRLRSNRGSWYGAARDAKKSYKLVIRAAEIDPENHDYYFGWGVYDYYVDALPRDKWYMKAADLFFPGGDRERGIAELERTFKHGRFLRAEAAYFLLQIYYMYEKDYRKSLYYATWLRVRYPNNAFFRALEGRVYGRWGRWGQAREVFDDVLARYERGQTGFTHAIAEQALYYRARSLMTQGNFMAAVDDLVRLNALTDRHPGDTVYKVLGRLRLGMCYDALGNRGRAVAYYREVLNKKDWSDSRDRAKRYLETPYGRRYAPPVTNNR